MSTRVEHGLRAFAIFIVIGVFLSSSLLAQAALDKEFETLSGTQRTLKSLGARGYVLIFFSESCPICQKYTPLLKKLQQQYASKGIRFVLVFPDTATSAKDVMAFLEKYHCTLESAIDRKQVLTKDLSARVTPEAFVLDSNGVQCYRGRIDNWFVAPGRMRSIVSSHELQESIEAMLNHRKAPKEKTTAVGCLIEGLHD